ncbi:hypothetical protein LCGC14_1008230 [marine sediment metagenome]|uniref:PseI/NeuA/B-like domain-containing protein n=1 Tax=marine sediment metagenome TaxID=412755 RepID=A0A0F9N5K7_9ZZZZ
MRCKLIAELSWNHLGNIDLAKKMITSAKSSGADYVKFQTWKASCLKSGSWDNDGRREIYEQAELSKQNHHDLKDYCEKTGIAFLTSCFNVSDLEMIKSVSSVVKIPSTECSNKELVTKAIDNFETVFISTGTATFKEYSQWAKYLNVWLLHCVSSYPCELDCINLPRMQAIANLTERYGYSGHCSSIWDAIAAISMGAQIIEKHFTVDKNLPGRDNKFALLPEQFSKISEYNQAWQSMIQNRGINFQSCEIDQRVNYRGRWSGKNFDDHQMS